MSTPRQRALARGYSWEPGYMGWLSPEEQMELDDEQAEQEAKDEEE